ncbi:MAG: hypothetical protein IPH93_16255 [Saprospiraceae bacterium]|nr:hypothetical protein [Saprospiraceae bacterium]MBK9632255.1 hypothetical protein [Saprospiraceae bacterium]
MGRLKQRFCVRRGFPAEAGQAVLRRHIYARWMFISPNEVYLPAGRLGAKTPRHRMLPNRFMKHTMISLMILIISLSLFTGQEQLMEISLFNDRNRIKEGKIVEITDYRFHGYLVQGTVLKYGASTKLTMPEIF